MTRSLILALTCFTAVAFADDIATQVPEIPYESVPNFLKLPPNLYLGEASGVGRVQCSAMARCMGLQR